MFGWYFMCCCILNPPPATSLRAVAADIGDSAITEYYIDFLYSIRESDQRSNEYYRGAVEEFPQCAPLLQSYGEYLDKVLNDPVEANHYYKLASEIVTL